MSADSTHTTGTSPDRLPSEAAVGAPSIRKTGLSILAFAAQRLAFGLLVLLAIVVMAFVTDKLWAALGKKLFPYREKLR